MNKKKFYDDHKNFACRTITEYFLSPGIKCKFDILKENIGSERHFKNAIDLGCSGNSFLYFLENAWNKSFFDLADFPLRQFSKILTWHPLCGDLIRLPYRNECFDFVSALDVLEHIKNDEDAVSEISRVLKRNGIVIITVPHRMKYYTNQDHLIGHYRRYEINQIISLFKKYNLAHIRSFGVYGQLMRIAEIQSANPEKIEISLLNLRARFESNPVFRKIWSVVVKMSAKIMKIDVKYHSLTKIMNIAFIFIKQ